MTNILWGYKEQFELYRRKMDALCAEIKGKPPDQNTLMRRMREIYDECFPYFEADNDT